MNCNQVFNILTRGPFPSGDLTDAAVEIHLATCPSCRCFAEALRPALDVYQETVSPEECGNLPGYWGDLAPVAAERAVKTAQRASRGSRPPRLHLPAPQPMLAVRQTQWLFAAAAALFVGCMFIASAINSLAGKMGSPSFGSIGRDSQSSGVSQPSAISAVRDPANPRSAADSNQPESAATPGRLIPIVTTPSPADTAAQRDAASANQGAAIPNASIDGEAPTADPGKE